MSNKYPNYCIYCDESKWVMIRDEEPICEDCAVNLLKQEYADAEEVVPEIVPTPPKAIGGDEK